MMQLLVACGFAAVGAMLFVSLRSRLDGLRRLIARTSNLERALLVVLAAAFVAYGGSKPVSVTVPDAANTTVEVKTNGVTAVTAGGVYTFDSGSSLQVDYTAHEGYAITANASTNIDFLFDAVVVTAPTVEPIAVTNVTLNETLIYLEVGKSATLMATVTPEEALDKTVTWATSDDSVATVVDGLVTAVSLGDATITATAGDKSATCTVKAGVPLYKMTVPVVEHAKLVAVSNGEDKVDFTFESDNTATFTVPSNSTVKVYFESENDYEWRLEKSVIETTVTSAGVIDVSGVNPQQIFRYDIKIDSAIEHGTVETSVTNAILPGTEVTVAATPDEGYALETLSVKQGEADVGVTDGKFAMPEGDVDVTATFTQRVFTVTFKTNGVDYVVKYGVPYETAFTDVKPSVAPEMEGHTFVEWDPSDVDKICSNMTFNAKFDVNKFKVTFMAEGRPYAVSNDVPWGTAFEDVKPKIDPTEEWPESGFPRPFGWWDPSDVLTIVSNTTFTAVFTAQKTFALTLTPGANTTIAKSPRKEKFLLGETVVITARPNEHYKFGALPDGWFAAENGTATNTYVIADKDDNAVTGPDAVLDTVTFTVKAIPGATVDKVYTNAGENAWIECDYTVIRGAKVKVTFKPDGAYQLTATEYVTDALTGDSTEIDAAETIKPIALYTVTFKVEGQADYVTNSIPSNTEFAVIRPADPTAPTGQSFKCWEPVEEFVVSNTTYTAAFTNNFYDITFKNADDTWNEVVSTEYNVMPVVPTAPDVTGHSFKEWTPAVVAAVEDATYTAVYTANVYAVTFENGENSTINPAAGTVDYDYGTQITVAATAAAGYEFAEAAYEGWEKQADGTLMTNVTVTGAATFKAPDATQTRPTVEITLPAKLPEGVDSIIVSQSADGEVWTPVIDRKIVVGNQWKVEGVAKPGYVVQNPISTGTAAEGTPIEVKEEDVEKKVAPMTYTVEVPAADHTTVAVTNGAIEVGTTNGTYTIGANAKVTVVYTPDEGYEITANASTNIEALVENVIVAAPKVKKTGGGSYTVEVLTVDHTTVVVTNGEKEVGTAGGTYTMDANTKVVVVYTPEAGYRITANASTNIEALVENVTVAAPTVEEIMVEAVSLDCAAKTLDVGDSFTLVATATPEDALDKTIVWKSSDSRIAKVDDGVVTAVCKGTATITATAVLGGASASCTVTVGLVPSGTVKEPKADGSGMVKGKSGSWSAKPNEACVFTGWVWEGEPEKLPAEFTSLSENELRNAKIKIANVSGVRPADVAATWAWIDEDKIESVDLTPSNLVVECKSYVTASAGGLPSGLKFDKKTLAITGLPKKTESKEVKVKIKNASGYTWNQSFTVEATAGVGITKITPADNAVKTGVPVMLVGGDSALGAVKGSKVIVAGKKASIKATPAKGSIFLGWYEDAVFDTPAPVTLLQKGYLTASQPVQVANDDITLYARIVKLESWAQGTFDGICRSADGTPCGTVTVTISNKGKVSGKALMNNATYSFKANAIEDADETGETIVFKATPVTKVGGVEKKLPLSVSYDINTGLGDIEINLGEVVADATADAVQNAWKLKPFALPDFAKNVTATTPDGLLTLTFAAKGVVKAAGQVSGGKVSAKAQVLPVVWDEDSGTLEAQACVYAPKASFCAVYDVTFTKGADGKFANATLQAE